MNPSVLPPALMGLGGALVLWGVVAPRRQRRTSSRGSVWHGYLAQAGLAGLPLPLLMFFTALGSFICALVAHALVRIPVVTLLAGVVGLVAPMLIVRARARRVRRTRHSLWPDVVDHIVALVRSGASIPGALAALAESGPAPLRPDFASFAADYRATADPDGSFDRLKERLGDPVGDRLIEVLRMARDVGGSDLVAVLRETAAALRAEQTIRQEVSARQSWVRNSAILGAAAPWIILILLVTRADAAAAYRTPAGAAVIVVGIAVTALAYTLMSALGRLREDGRWFR